MRVSEPLSLCVSLSAFVCLSQAMQCSRQSRLSQWANEAARLRKAGDAAVHSYGKPPPGLTLVEALMSDGYHGFTDLKLFLDHIVQCMLKLSEQMSSVCHCAGDLRMQGYLPLVMMQDCDMASTNAVLASFNDCDIVSFSIMFRSTLLVVDSAEETLEVYLVRIVQLRLVIPAWCFRHFIKALREHPLYVSGLKVCVDSGFKTINFKSHSKEDNSKEETASNPPEATQTQNTDSVRGRFSDTINSWGLKLIFSRTELHLIAVSHVVAVGFSTSHVPVGVAQEVSDVRASISEHHSSCKEMLKSLRSSLGACSTYHDVISELQAIPKGEQLQSVLHDWFKVFVVDQSRGQYIWSCALGGLVAEVVVTEKELRQGIPNPWCKPDLWSYLCKKFPYYLLWSHIVPILAFLLRMGSQTVEIMNKLHKNTTKDIMCRRTKKTAYPLDQYWAVRCPLMIAEQMEYVEREREAATWAHTCGLGLSPDQVRTFTQLPLIHSITDSRHLQAVVTHRQSPFTDSHTARSDALLHSSL